MADTQEATIGRMKAPLQGVRVLDLSRVLAGPVCCQLLADLGADVVKVERPGSGDDTRQWGPPFLGDDGPSAYYLSANRGKRSLALDLSHADAGALLDDLIRHTDVLVENFLPSSLEKFGLTPERLAELNPKLVVCSISGYGRTGPLADVPGYDLVIQAGSGLMSITGEPEGQPMKVGVAITDVICGLYAASSALAGLFAREQTRTGTAFDLALADCTLASLVNVAQSALITGERPARYGNAHPQIVPYEAFDTSDGHLVLAVGNDAQWQRFCKAVGNDAWSDDERFTTNPLRVQHREELIHLLLPLFKTRSTTAWCQLLTKAEVPHGPVNRLDEVLADPQYAAREMILDAKDSQGREFPLLGGAIHWQDEPPRTAACPPELGQHTDEVLSEWLQLDAKRIAALREQGVVA